MAIVTSATDNAQVTIPLKLHQPFSGFGLLESKRKAVPADFDPANLLQIAQR